MSLIIPKKPLTKPKGKETQKVMAMMKSELREEGVVIINDRGINKCNFNELLSYYFHTFKRDPVVRFRVRNTKIELEKKNIPPPKNVLTAALCAIGEKDSDLKGLSLTSLCNIHIALTGAKYVRDGKEKHIKTDKQAYYYSKRVYKGSIRSNGRGNYKLKYRMYLRSPEWKNKRKEVLVDRNNKCERCGSNKKLEVHHKTYERIFNEDLSDLELLCKSCHEKEHNIAEVAHTV